MYKCECGKEFEKPNSFNGHKSSCKIHQINKHGSLDFFNLTHYNQGKKLAERNKEIKKNKAAKDLAIWISEKHTCERCGKVMTEKFGSGRFCSRGCANSKFINDEVKTKISNSVSESWKKKPKKIYKCVICNSDITTNKKTCSKECCNILHSMIAKKMGFGTTQRETAQIPSD